MSSENFYRHLLFCSLSLELKELHVGLVFGNSVSDIVDRVSSLLSYQLSSPRMEPLPCGQMGSGEQGAPLSSLYLPKLELPSSCQEMWQGRRREGAGDNSSATDSPCSYWDLVVSLINISSFPVSSQNNLLYALKTIETLGFSHMF